MPHSARTSDRHRRAAAVTLLAGALSLTGCGTAVTPAASDATASHAVSLTNCARELTIGDVPEHVVGMHPAQTELLLRLGLADRLAGQAQATAQHLPDDVAALAADVPVIGGAMPPSREDLLATEPDFVYSPTTYEFSAEKGFASLEQLTAAGASVYVATGGCQDRRMTGEVVDLFTDLDNLGRIFDRQERAEQLIAENQAVLDRVAAATADVEPLRVAEVYVEGSALQVIGAGVEHDILLRAGAKPVYAPEQALFSDFFAATITAESLAAEAPDALVIAPYDAENEAMMRDYLTRTFPDMPAVRDGRIIAVPSSDMFPGTLGNITAVQTIAEALYPDAFGR